MPDPIDPADPTAKDHALAQRLGAPVGRFMQRWRAIIKRKPWLNGVYKILITIFGAAIVLLGLILVPFPGPGWLIVFVGFTILGSEYHWARRFTGWLRIKLAGFWARVKTYKETRAAERRS